VSSSPTTTDTSTVSMTPAAQPTMASLEAAVPGASSTGDSQIMTGPGGLALQPSSVLQALRGAAPMAGS